jgi:hypothetical protein
VLTPILATDDPYQSAAVFVSAGWSLVFQTPEDSGDPLAVVELAGARLMLGTSLPQFLPAESRPHKGAGVEFHLTVPADDVTTVFEGHREHAESVTDLTAQPWGELAFHAVLLGYKFLIAADGDSRPDQDARPRSGLTTAPPEPADDDSRSRKVAVKRRI